MEHYSITEKDKETLFAMSAATLDEVSSLPLLAALVYLVHTDLPLVQSRASQLLSSTNPRISALITLAQISYEDASAWLHYMSPDLKSTSPVEAVKAALPSLAMIDASVCNLGYFGNTLSVTVYYHFIMACRYMWIRFSLRDAARYRSFLEQHNSSYITAPWNYLTALWGPERMYILSETDPACNQYRTLRLYHTLFDPKNGDSGKIFDGFKVMCRLRYASKHNKMSEKELGIEMARIMKLPDDE
jgi:hypothetical protein